MASKHRTQCSVARTIIDNFISYWESQEVECKTFKDKGSCERAKMAPDIIEVLGQVDDELDGAYCMRGKNH